MVTCVGGGGALGIVHRYNGVPGVFAQLAIGGQTELTLEAAHRVGHVGAILTVLGLLVDARIQGGHLVQPHLHVAHVLPGGTGAQRDAGPGVGAAVVGGVVSRHDGVPGGGPILPSMESPFSA